MNNKKIIIFLAILLTLVIGGTLTYLKTRNPHPNLPEITDISDWQTYNNPKWGVSFKYPKGWKLCDYGLKSKDNSFSVELFNTDLNLNCHNKFEVEGAAAISFSIQQDTDHRYANSQTAFQFNYKETYVKDIANPLNHLAPFSVDGLQAFGGELGSVYREGFFSGFESYIVAKDNFMHISNPSYYKKQGSTISGYKPQFDAFLKSISFGDRWR